jgi:hypothetical protein
MGGRRSRKIRVFCPLAASGMVKAMVGRMGQPDYRLTREEVCAIEENFRSMTHKVANWLTVVKALAELGNEHHGTYEKLISKKLMQCPELVFQIRAFSDEMYKRMNPLVPLPAPALTDSETQALSGFAG